MIEFGPAPLGSAIAVFAVAGAVTGATAAAATTRTAVAAAVASREMKRDIVLVLCGVVYLERAVAREAGG
jgi:pectin methylesterase-like acyl-CoA thioesterase